jgi:NAD-dependent deacetylase
MKPHGAPSPELLARAVDQLRKARSIVAFTGAGISVESGIAPFRGENGVWNKHDPEKFHKRYFLARPADSWATIKEVFYDHVGDAGPNDAHRALADLERAGRLDAVITQNIDGLHAAAGSERVFEYHGSLDRLDCMQCRFKTPLAEVSLATLPPPCPICGGLLKPDIVFFGEPIPEEAMRGALEAVENCDVLLVVGSTGEVQPACRLPHIASNRARAMVIEVNVHPSAFTDNVTDIFLQAPAARTLRALADGVLHG